MKSVESILDCACEAARAAGDVLREMQGAVATREKGPADLVTDADLASQQLIRQILTSNHPEFGFVGEEGTHDDLKATLMNETCWVVDPLDGTTNYIHGLDNYSVSIALQRNGRVALGVVFDPVRNELFSVVAGQGAELNHSPLSTSGIERLDRSLIAASFPPKVAPESPEISRFVRMLCRAQAVRRLGSAALNLCYVAAGRLDGYWATSVNAWDVAAGALMVQEAGGTLTQIDGSPLRLDEPRLVAAASRSLHGEMVDLLAD